MAKPYKEGAGWCIREFYKNNEIYISGCKKKKDLAAKLNERRTAIDRNQLPIGKGPDQTTVAQALQDYAMERLPFMKGAVQEARRMNHYLRYAGLQLLVVTKLQATVTSNPDKTKTGQGAYFEVTLAPHTTQRNIVGSLQAHRRHQLTENARTEKYRAVIATTPVGKVTRKLLQDFIFAMMRDRNAASTIALERSMLRVLFYHAHSVWHWHGLQDNHASQLKMPKVDNERKRVVSEEERPLLDAAIADCRNVLVGPTLDLLSATAMRATEPLEKACWRDVDWKRCVLTLHDPKEGGKSEVPLSPDALDALRALQKLGTGEPDAPIVAITYEALRAAFTRVCERAGIEDLHMHDLRRTAGTNMALKTGNIFLVQALTRHKTLSMVQRYVQVGADDAVKVMHAQKKAEQEAAAAKPTHQALQAAPAPAPSMISLEQMHSIADAAAKAASAASAAVAAMHAQMAAQVPASGPVTMGSIPLVPGATQAWVCHSNQD